MHIHLPTKLRIVPNDIMVPEKKRCRSKSDNAKQNQANTFEPRIRFSNADAQKSVTSRRPKAFRIHSCNSSSRVSKLLRRQTQHAARVYRKMALMAKAILKSN